MNAQDGMPWAPVAHEPGEGLDDDPTPRGVVGAALDAALDFYSDDTDEHRSVSIAESCEPESQLRSWREEFGTSHARPLRVLDIGSGY